MSRSGSRSLGVLGLAFALALPSAAMAQRLAGMVWDGAAGAPVADARVIALSAQGAPLGDPIATGLDGRFELFMDTGIEEVFLIAEKAGYATSAPQLASGPDGPVAGLLLEVRPVQPVRDAVTLEARTGSDVETAQVVGFVVDRDNGRPVPSAEVEVVGTERRITTDANGMFVLRDLPPGETGLAISHLSYATSGKLFRAEAGQAYELRATLAPEAIALEGIEVTSRTPSWYRQMEGLQFRMSRGLGGTFVLDTQIEARGYPPVAELLRELPGTRIRKVNRFDYTVNFRRCELPPVLYIDGVQVNQPEEGAALPELAMVPAMDIQAIEVYRGAGTLPPEFAGPDAMCGAIVIWTKRGG
ncbi:MAG: TonB-dependent receptor [Gemmatimonadetes bacterium]|nr:TonB-dependent receptor [Gemmatimonadota bacterium]